MKEPIQGLLRNCHLRLGGARKPHLLLQTPVFALRPLATDRTRNDLEQILKSLEIADKGYY